ncbi:hypothetical protein [Nostoc sp. ChiQUE01b]|uniref:hypothetical protein n=1 Tax=Nostoc sp. ChiQUE01b TaxID=3075376 RepID=UPI002AD4EF82|nr:hypothetical protein [Nostoc sp. ChiQUE01b]MDZ8260599.1 hypothetical protein [Nostoc sp. ChiQUE01b]
MNTGDIFFIKREFSRKLHELDKTGLSIRVKNGSLLETTQSEYIVSLQKQAAQQGYIPPFDREEAKEQLRELLELKRQEDEKKALAEEATKSSLFPFKK